jgi:hypothetical protein
MQILKESVFDWCEMRLIRKFYVDQSVKVQLDQGETSSVNTGRLNETRMLSPI